MCVTLQPGCTPVTHAGEPGMSCEIATVPPGRASNLSPSGVVANATVSPAGAVATVASTAAAGTRAGATLGAAAWLPLLNTSVAGNAAAAALSSPCTAATGLPTTEAPLTDTSRCVPAVTTPLAADVAATRVTVHAPLAVDKPRPKGVRVNLMVTSPPPELIHVDAGLAAKSEPVDGALKDITWAIVATWGGLSDSRLRVTVRVRVAPYACAWAASARRGAYEVIAECVGPGAHGP
jgi:hypothetical protein